MACNRASTSRYQIQQTTKQIPAVKVTMLNWSRINQKQQLSPKDNIYKCKILDKQLQGWLNLSRSVSKKLHAFFVQYVINPTPSCAWHTP
jgi:hypothetical protein